MEARGGIEPPMRVLQTLALPLGYRARSDSLCVTGNSATPEMPYRDLKRSAHIAIMSILILEYAEMQAPFRIF